MVQYCCTVFIIRLTDLMPINKLPFDYDAVSTTVLKQRESPDTKLPSVTRILDETMPDEKRLVLENWRKNIGEEAAEKITKESAAVGSIMHLILEHWVKNEEVNVGSNLIHRQARQMANTIIKNSEGNLDEVWGNEVWLYYPNVYAGITDLVGLWKGKSTILDFKQTNKPKKVEWIDDYFIQGAAYAMAHDELFNTNINNITILMCSRACQMQIFEVDSPKEIQMWKDKWARRVEEYYSQ